MTESEVTYINTVRDESLLPSDWACESTLYARVAERYWYDDDAKYPLDALRAVADDLPAPELLEVGKFIDHVLATDDDTTDKSCLLYHDPYNLRVSEHGIIFAAVGDIYTVKEILKQENDDVDFQHALLKFNQHFLAVLSSAALKLGGETNQEEVLSKFESIQAKRLRPSKISAIASKQTVAVPDDILPLFDVG
jgi:hypothetical protein